MLGIAQLRQLAAPLPGFRARNDRELAHEDLRRRGLPDFGKFDCSRQGPADKYEIK